ncbi:hypothetical protein OY671_008370 [Metschnikowia pulcherrima]|nr:hypothetical protein OY671_008370 [Metschnikowia pulcherrima]
MVALGERVRRSRAIRGMTRKGSSQVTGVSERHSANLEHGVGNASISVSLQIAKAFNCASAESVGDVTTESPDWLSIRELLSGRGEGDSNARLAPPIRAVAATPPTPARREASSASTGSDRTLVPAEIAMRRWRLYRFVWHRSSFEIASFVASTGAVSGLPLTFIH